MCPFFPTMLLTAASWETIFQQIHLDRKRFTGDQLYWNKKIAALVLDPVNFAEQQLERFKSYGHMNRPY